MYTSGYMDEVLTVADTASFLQKHPDTIRSWIKSGCLKAKIIPAGGKGVYVLLKNDVLEYMLQKSISKEKNPVKKTKVNPNIQKQFPI